MSSAPNFSRSRFTVAVTLATYPLATAVLYALAAFTPEWPLWLRAAIMVPAIATLMIWVLIPMVQSQLRVWLHP